MNARQISVVVALFIAVPLTCSAAKPSSASKARSPICGADPPPANWKFTDTAHEYPGIIVGTKMTLKANGSDEWQITLSTETTEPPPNVETLHLVKVCAGTDVVSLPHEGQSYLAAAYLDVMSGKHNYYAAIGTLQDKPTLALLTMFGDVYPRQFTLVFVKVKEADLVHVRQGGVLHGQEN